jgi:hypothetical protein
VCLESGEQTVQITSCQKTSNFKDGIREDGDVGIYWNQTERVLRYPSCTGTGTCTYQFQTGEPTAEEGGECYTYHGTEGDQELTVRLVFAAPTVRTRAFTLKYDPTSGSRIDSRVRSHGSKPGPIRWRKGMKLTPSTKPLTPSGPSSVEHQAVTSQRAAQFWGRLNSTRS